ncbi:MAG: amino acid ABC transporter permease [Acidimicrobiales bacterium]
MQSIEGHRPEEIRAVPLRHPGRWAAAAVLLVLAAMLAHNMVTNPRWQWGVIRSNLFSPPIVSGAENTIKITIFAMAIGVILGILLAVMRLSPNQVLSSAAWLFIWFFRGTPVYLQLTFWYAISSLFPTFSLGVPFGPEFVHLSANTIITPLVAGLLGLGLNEGAYYAEIVRAGILSVDHGQFEAAQSLGMRRATLMRKIVLPQAMRVIVPPTGNELNNMLKTTSLLVVVTYPELMYQTTNDAARTFEAIPFYVGACMWYLFMTTLLTIGQFYVERYYARGTSYALPPTPIQRMRRNLTTLRRIPFSASGTGGS